MSSSNDKASSKDQINLDQENVTDVNSRLSMHFKLFRLLCLGLYSVVGVFLYYSLLANFLNNSQVRNEDSISTLEKVNFLYFQRNTLGYRILETLRKGPDQYSGIYNSFQEEKKAYSMKIKLALHENAKKVTNLGSDQVVEFGETQFRRNLLTFENFWIGIKSSDNYVPERLRSPTLVVKRNVLSSFYPAIREPPRSLKINTSDSSTYEYIHEFVANDPNRLYYGSTLRQYKLPMEQLEKISNWARSINGGSKSGSLNLIPEKEVPDYELIKIVNNGPPKNRIDMVFMGDGYTKEERGKFIDDITRLSKELFEEVTFKMWLPLINVWAAFVPSVDSGIGTGGKPNGTPFGLYRENNELRGIYSSKLNSVRAICNHLGYAMCDFPLIIANDDYFGGLGGEHIISTRSILSGTIVLRHEMGHTFNEVGGEQDGGLEYSGINVATSLNYLPWKHWLSDMKFDGIQREPTRKFGDPKHTDIKEEKSFIAVQDYSWHDLTKNGPYNIAFNSTGEYSRWYIKISTSGMATEGSFKAYLDGVELPWKAPGTLDRTFSTWFNSTHGLGKGSHQLHFEVEPSLLERDLLHQLCNVEVIEYASEEEFHWDDPQRISAYPTYGYKHRKTYRPTNEYCLMRNMTSTQFCPVCTEGLWLKFLDRVNLIDKLEIKRVRLPKSQVQYDSHIPYPEPTDYVVVTKDSPNHHFVNSKKHRKFTMGYLIDTKLIGLDPNYLDGHRKKPEDSTSKWGYTLNWYHNNRKVKNLDDITSFAVPETSPYIVGIWDLRVIFNTPQVREDTQYILTSRETFILKQPS